MSLAAKKHDCPTCRCTRPLSDEERTYLDRAGSQKVSSEPVDTSKLLQQVRDVLARHHMWQLQADGLVMEWEDEGEIVRLDISDEYGDSSLYHDTVDALMAVEINSQLQE
jgi:hypothetical protein